jgi:glycerate 2-kinase
MLHLQRLWFDYLTDPSKSQPERQPLAIRARLLNNDEFAPQARRGSRRMSIQGETLGSTGPSYEHGKATARRVFHEVIAAIDLRKAMVEKLTCIAGMLHAGETSVSLTWPPHVVAIGKAAGRMASKLDEILEGRIASGIVVAPGLPAARLKNFRYFEGGHPYPNSDSIAGAEAALGLVSRLGPSELVIFLISGGGSALFEKPLNPNVSLRDLVEFNRVLVTCGLPIEQINVLRKHISAVKGGRLAEAAHPARQLTLFVSDVPDNLPSMVASGPTMPDSSTLEECYRLAEENKLVPRLPQSIREHFIAHTLKETPKPGAACFKSSGYFCLLSNREAVEAAQNALELEGFICEIESGDWDADYREVADRNLKAFNALAEKHPGKPVALVVGGEVTCQVTGSGMGGRNQAFVLYAAEKIEHQNRVVLSAGTDGRDGNSPSSGAVADGQTISRARALGIDPVRYLAGSDSYSFFRTLGDTLDTGYTGNNVRDVRLWLDFGDT